VDYQKVRPIGRASYLSDAAALLNLGDHIDRFLSLARVEVQFEVALPVGDFISELLLATYRLLHEHHELAAGVPGRVGLSHHAGASGRAAGREGVTLASNLRFEEPHEVSLLRVGVHPVRNDELRAGFADEA
jgi:hypothetical protein